MQSLIGFFIQNKVAVFIFVVMSVIFGSSAYNDLPREAAPDLKIPVVLATVAYPGVSPTDIETLIVRELETELKDVRDVKVMKSTAAEGVAIISLEFEPTVDIEEAVRKVREKVDQARPNLPEDALDPVVQEVSFEDFPIISVSLSADYSPLRLKQVAESLQEDLETVKGVLEVKLTGAIEREIQVVVDPDRLAFHGVSIDEVTRAIQGENINLPGGMVEAGRSSFLVRVPGEYSTPSEIENVVIKTRARFGSLDHTALYVRDVARVIDTFKERSTMSRINRTPSVTLQISKRGGENLIRIADEVKDTVNNAALPPGTRVAFLADQSTRIRNMVTDLQNNILTGLLLVLAVLPFFLTIRSSFIVATAIPLSFLISLFVIQMQGMTLNMIVLFSLILSLGMLVDNSIVIVENTYRLLSEGYSRTEAALRGTVEVAWPVIASTATTVAAFVPLLFWPGIMGKFMGFLPQTLIITLLSSLFVALFINPVMCAVFLQVNDKHVIDEDSEPTGFIYRLYRRTLEFALAHRALTLIGVFFSLIATGALYGSMKLGVEFFPASTPDTVFVEIRAADGTRLEATDEIVRKIEAGIEGSPHVQNFVSSVGAGGGGSMPGMGGGGGNTPNQAQIQIDFVDAEERTESSLTTMEHFRKFIDKLAGAKFEMRKQGMGPPSGAPVAVELSGDDWETLGHLTQKVNQAIQGVPGLVDLKDDFNLGRPEVQIRVDREKAKLVGTSTFQVAQAVRTAINGSKATTFRDGVDEFDVTVRLEEHTRYALESLESLIVTGREGKQVPLREVATIETGAGAGSIRHKDRVRLISISANAEGRLPDEVRKDVVKILSKMEFPKGYTWRLGGENEEQEKAKAFLGRAFLIAALSILLIVVLQFNSLLSPLIIMTSVVLSTIGVLWGLIIFQRPFGVIMTGLGVISLAGVAVNNAIVLIDFIEKQEHKPGVTDLREAIIKAGVIRLRPVLLTAITTVLGLMPMVFGVSVDFINAKVSMGGQSAEMWSGMAIAVSFGLMFTTFLTLVVVPVLQDILEPLWRRMVGVFHRVAGSAEAPPARGASADTTPAAATAKQG